MHESELDGFILIQYLLFALVCYHYDLLNETIRTIINIRGPLYLFQQKIQILQNTPWFDFRGVNLWMHLYLR